MDTRQKILTRQTAHDLARRLQGNGRRLVIVTGYFDPLLADHVRKLRQLAQTKLEAAILAIVLNPTNPLLSQQARVELVAALSMVDYVLPLEHSDLEPSLKQFHAEEIVRQEQDDRERVRGLIEHVHRRQTG
jgi:D-beta-D-heptose 7-phosphate kinase/D-beta-D-heptose 1-phosphate adenosyltransferase